MVSCGANPARRTKCMGEGQDADSLLLAFPKLNVLADCLGCKSNLDEVRESNSPSR